MARQFLVALAPDHTFVLPRSREAADEEAELVLSIAALDKLDSDAGRGRGLRRDPATGPWPPLPAAPDPSQVPDARRERRLRDAAHLGGTREMLFARQRYQILHLSNEHARRLLFAM